MAYDNGVLLSNTACYVTYFLIPNNNSNVTFMITEFQPVQGSGAGTGNQSPNEPSMTLYDSSPQISPVQIQTQTATNPVTIPQYSVVRLEWTVFSVPRPALSVTSTNQVATLHWAGLTNVVYNVQSSTNLVAWSTLGRVSSTQTNFSFTDANSRASRFYRLTMP